MQIDEKEVSVIFWFGVRVNMVNRIQWSVRELWVAWSRLPFLLTCDPSIPWITVNVNVMQAGSIWICKWWLPFGSCLHNGVFWWDCAFVLVVICWPHITKAFCYRTSERCYRLLECPELFKKLYLTMLLGTTSTVLHSPLHMLYVHKYS